MPVTLRLGGGLAQRKLEGRSGLVETRWIKGCQFNVRHGCFCQGGCAQVASIARVRQVRRTRERLNSRFQLSSTVSFHLHTLGLPQAEQKLGVLSRIDFGGNACQERFVRADSLRPDAGVGRGRKHRRNIGARPCVLQGDASGESDSSTVSKHQRAASNCPPVQLARPRP